MARHSKPAPPAFTIQAVAACDADAQRLWHDLHGPSCAGTKPAHCLVAREDDSNRLLGIAQYFRTFPPEDACGAVLVVPNAAGVAVGERLLQSMADQALGAGVRNLGTLVGGQDVTTLELLRRADMPVRVSPIAKELYVEMDLVTFANASGRRQPADPQREPVPTAVDHSRSK